MVYEQASGFFYDKDSSAQFFSLFSSCSYTVWVLAGLFVRESSKTHVGIYPSWLLQWLPSVAVLFAVSFVVFHCLCFPLWFTLVKPFMIAKNPEPVLSEANFTESFSGLAASTHTAALLVGMSFLRKRAPRSLAPGGLWISFKSLTGHLFRCTSFAASVSFGLCAFFASPSTAAVLKWLFREFTNFLKYQLAAFVTSMSVLLAHSNLFSTSIMVIFYVGLFTIGMRAYHLQTKLWTKLSSPTAQSLLTHPFDGCPEEPQQLPPDTNYLSRQRKYQNVFKVQRLVPPLLSMAPWFGMLLFFSTRLGVWCFTTTAYMLSGFSSERTVAESPLWVLCFGSIATTCGSILTFIPFARAWDGLYAENPGMRNQQSKTYDTTGLWRLEVGLCCLNLHIAAIVSTAVSVIHVKFPGVDKLYFSSPFESCSAFAYLLFSAAVFFLWIDLCAYVAHRALHIPCLYKPIHKLHHRWKQTTAFTALAMHPVDLLSIMFGIYSGFYILPLHPSAIVVNLLYNHYHNVIHHSGVYAESWLPWEPSSLYHDDHHKLFHVNFGQSLTIWDRLGGTFYAANKRYSEKIFTW
ncbi:hypothetical protein CYMTET_23138 [Cymbomonas tetramitiformis]|uniref:Fatty acid hydroxylase domain-containing protein n=1 Tax=Cymbomonas tetramitiformis TaxID=36881 RepID=A0AAE0L189_9CHLO|nr:hypothetical protein CYMTET_23138 [Cymbomonas tetramitiformis]|eukprot:gene18120-21581_t